MVRKSSEQPFWIWPAVAVIGAIGLSVLVLLPLLPSIPEAPESGGLLRDGRQAQPAVPIGGRTPGS
jgi:hypothetical protein